MKPVAPVAPAIFALALLAAPAQAASFDCAKAGTEIEHMICGDAELSQLDELLGDRYVRARAKTDDAKALHAGQRAWLSDVREACADADCLKAAYEARIAELTDIVWTGKKTERAICDEVVEALNDGTLEDRFVEFRNRSEEEAIAWEDSASHRRYGVYLDKVLEVDYDGDGRTDKLGQISRKCLGRRIFDLPDGKPLRTEPEDMGLGDRFLVVRGQGVIARVSYTRNILYVVGVHALTHGVDQPALCGIRRTPDMRAEIVQESDPSLCRAVATGRIEVLSWLPADGLELSDDEMWLDGIAGTVVLDLDLDGNEDTIALLNWSRGSGCGLDWRTMEQLDPVTRMRPDNPLNGFLRANTDGVWTYPDDKDRWYSPVVLRFRGKPYFFGGPGNPVVASFWGGEAREWCRFRLLPQHEAYPPEE